MMEEEIVRRRAWLSHEEFLDLLGATNFIPGPNSTEMAIHVGFRRAGWRGLVVAGACFILPAVLIVTAIAWAYVRFGRLPEVSGVLYGVKPVVIAVVVQALGRLGRVALKTRVLAVVALVAAGLTVAGVNELVVLFGAGAVLSIVRWELDRRSEPPGRPVTPAAFSLPSIPAAAAATATAATAVGLWPLFLVFLKAGSVLFGSGYVLLALLRADLVSRHHWLTEAQLLDATAVGQVTPGPVFTTATFIGYLLHGPRGAFVATLGIFLPAFVFVAASAPLLPRLRSSRVAASFLDGLNAASLALMAVVTWQLGRAALVDVPTMAIAAVSGALILWMRVNSAWLVMAGAIVGMTMTRL